MLKKNECELVAIFRSYMLIEKRRETLILLHFPDSCDSEPSAEGNESNVMGDVVRPLQFHKHLFTWNRTCSSPQHIRPKDTSKALTQTIETHFLSYKHSCFLFLAQNNWLCCDLFDYRNGTTAQWLTPMRSRRSWTPCSAQCSACRRPGNVSDLRLLRCGRRTSY